MRPSNAQEGSLLSWQQNYCAPLINEASWLVAAWFNCGPRLTNQNDRPAKVGSSTWRQLVAIRSVHDMSTRLEWAAWTNQSAPATSYQWNAVNQVRFGYFGLAVSIWLERATSYLLKASRPSSTVQLESTCEDLIGRWWVDRIEARPIESERAASGASWTQPSPSWILQLGDASEEAGPHFEWPKWTNQSESSTWDSNELGELRVLGPD